MNKKYVVNIKGIGQPWVEGVVCDSYDEAVIVRERLLKSGNVEDALIYNYYNAFEGRAIMNSFEKEGINYVVPGNLTIA